jgi:tetratricopeptide (TPR) repeat protein
LSRHALSPQGWVAWGDVNYLNNHSQRAAEIWEQALEQKDPADQLYARLARIYQSNGELAKATEYLQKYVSAQPKDADARYRLGLLLILSDPNLHCQIDRRFQLTPSLIPQSDLRTALNLAPDDRTRRLVIIGRAAGR